jgi:DNA-binding NtrC family response regulator
MPTRKSLIPRARILVTDDNPSLRKLLVTNLRTAGFQAREARFGTEALQMLGRTHFSLFILDLDMADTDTFEVLKVVKSKHPGVHVVAISGYMDGVLLGAAECLGATLSLERDHAPKLLVGAVRRLLGSN